MLKPLLMQRSQKLGLALVFRLVTIDMIFDLLRTVYLTIAFLSQYPDRYNIWVILDPTIAVIVCALPCYGSLVGRRKPEGQQCELEIPTNIWST
ncbi:hypothetical protein BDV96DRAFT_574883 [Lophiotrema nucula]|uniref:Uncharacterized protein n=1 Tax=Lophiotrema nucula TaxID=690887 RepID=A0A6A5Z9L0_9PLEO|nr:hypothetical protein BDV96DRAFT_574883 [Lophiotrema nucula]